MMSVNMMAVYHTIQKAYNTDMCILVHMTVDTQSIIIRDNKENGLEITTK